MTSELFDCERRCERRVVEKLVHAARVAWSVRDRSDEYEVMEDVYEGEQGGKSSRRLQWMVISID